MFEKLSLEVLNCLLIFLVSSLSFKFLHELLVLKFGKSELLFANVELIKMNLSLVVSYLIHKKVLATYSADSTLASRVGNKPLT